MPRIRSVSDVKANLLRPALTSHYEVFIGIPSRDKNGKSSRQFVDYLSRNKITWTISQDKIHLSCSEALLPGSSFATHELTGDRTGVTERHIYRRVYDDRIDLTFYIDINPKDPYVSLRFFETWMKGIVNEDEKSKNINYNYRPTYPDEYTADQGLKIFKFERDYQQFMTYEFIRSFPLSISSMPVSYSGNDLLKCTVSMSYIRYIQSGPNSNISSKGSLLDIFSQAKESLLSDPNASPFSFEPGRFGAQIRNMGNRAANLLGLG